MHREPSDSRKLRIYQKEGYTVKEPPDNAELLIKRTPKYNREFLAQVAGYETGRKPGQIANVAYQKARKKGKATAVTIEARDIDKNDKSGNKVELSVQQIENLTSGARYFLANGLNEGLFLDLRNILKDLMKNNENIVYWPLSSLAKQYPEINRFLTQLKMHLTNQYRHLSSSDLNKIISDYEQMPLSVFISANIVLSQPTVSLLDENYKLATAKNPPQPFTSLTAAGIDFQVPLGTKFENEKDRIAGVHTYFFGPPSAPLDEATSIRRLKNILGSMIEAELDSAQLQGISIISAMPRGLVSFADVFKLIKHKPEELALLQKVYWETFAEKVAQEKYSELEIYVNPLRSMSDAKEALAKNTSGATVILHDVDLKSLAVNLANQEATKPKSERRQVGITNAGDAKALIRLENIGMHFGEKVTLAPNENSNPKYGQDEMQNAQFLTSIHDEPKETHVLTKNSDPKKAQEDLVQATGIGSVKIRAAAPAASAPIRKEDSVASRAPTPPAATSVGTWQNIPPRAPSAVPTPSITPLMSAQRRQLDSTGQAPNKSSADANLSKSASSLNEPTATTGWQRISPRGIDKQAADTQNVVQKPAQIDISAKRTILPLQPDDQLPPFPIRETIEKSARETMEKSSSPLNQRARDFIIQLDINNNMEGNKPYNPHKRNYSNEFRSEEINKHKEIFSDYFYFWLKKQPNSKDLIAIFDEFKNLHSTAFYNFISCLFNLPAEKRTAGLGGTIPSTAPASFVNFFFAHSFLKSHLPSLAKIYEEMTSKDMFKQLAGFAQQFAENHRRERIISDLQNYESIKEEIKQKFPANLQKQLEHEEVSRFIDQQFAQGHNTRTIIIKLLLNQYFMQVIFKKQLEKSTNEKTNPQREDLLKNFNITEAELRKAELESTSPSKTHSPRQISPRSLE